MALDKVNKDVYIYYSGVTDKTGGALAAALNVMGGTNKPASRKLVIGYGAKTKEDISWSNSTTVWNHPNVIRKNRNKFTALQLMKDAGVAVAPFVAAANLTAALKDPESGISFPLVARRNYHQGSKGFHTILGMGHVNTALAGEKPMQYFQKYIDVDREYRLHIMFGELIYAQRKVERDNVAEAYVEQHKEKLLHSANKKKQNLDSKTLDTVLKRIAGEEVEVNNIARSNKLGWKFSNVKLENVKEPLLTQAVNAVKAIGLDFGAVDCCIDVDGNPWIIEVNTGPGLEGTPFDKYVEALRTKIDALLNPAPKPVKKAAAPVKEKTMEVGKQTEEKRGGHEGGLSMMDLLAVADDDELKSLRNMARKAKGI